jgi:hypothetical protein
VHPDRGPVRPGSLPVITQSTTLTRHRVDPAVVSIDGSEAPVDQLAPASGSVCGGKCAGSLRADRCGVPAGAAMPDPQAGRAPGGLAIGSSGAGHMDGKQCRLQQATRDALYQRRLRSTGRRPA